MSRDRSLQVLIKRYGRDAVLEITETVLDHCLDFRVQVLRLNEPLPVLGLDDDKPSDGEAA